MKCKHIPDQIFLKAIATTEGISPDEDSWRMAWEVNKMLNVLMNATIDEKLFRAKAGKLIGKGLIFGCNCGCRGDYYLSPKGKELLNDNHAMVN